MCLAERVKGVLYLLSVSSITTVVLGVFMGTT